MDTTTLAKLYGLDGPFVTVYVATPSDIPDAAQQLDTRWKNILRELGEAGVDDATLDGLTAARGEHDRGETRVLVAAHGTVHLAVSLPTPTAREEALVQPLPRLVPLVEALSRQLPHVVVLAERTRADVVAYTSGPDPVTTETVASDRFPDHKVHAGGWAAKRYDNDVEETWEKSARDLAGLVERVARDIDARLVIGSGDERAIQLLAEHLPAAVSEHFVTVGGGGRHRDGSDEVIAADVLRVLSDAAAGDEVDLLESFAEERGQHDRAADGVVATIEALRQGQVATLILTDARDAGRTGWFGPDATHVSLAVDELRDLGADAPAEALLDEILVRAALGTGADVRFVGGGMEQSPSEGVGALLRYAT